MYVHAKGGWWWLAALLSAPPRSAAPAQVVCRQLGMPGPGRAVGAAAWGSSAGPVHPIGVYCTSYQSRLGACNLPSVAACTHAQVRAGRGLCHT